MAGLLRALGSARSKALVAAVALTAASVAPLVGTSAHADALVVPDHQAANQDLVCDAADAPETGLQGEVPAADQLSGRALDGYGCGLSLVGYDDLGGQGYNANMVWVGDCAFVATAGQGVHVVDVTDPRHPERIATVSGRSLQGTGFTLETLGAFDGSASGQRSLLLVGRYGPQPQSAPAAMDVYDVSTCTTASPAEPVLVTTYTWPENIHNFTFSPDGGRVWSTLPLESIDVSRLLDPDADLSGVPAMTDSSDDTWIVYEGNLEDHLQKAEEAEIEARFRAGDPVGAAEHFDHRFWDEFLSHEVATSADPRGDTLYVGGQTPEWDTFSIIDVSDWPASASVIEQRRDGRGHSVKVATINGDPYVLHSEESILDATAKGCVPAELNPVGGASQPWITPLSADGRSIRLEDTVTFTLEINDPANCATQVADRMNSSVHYHDLVVEQHETRPDAAFALASMWNSGLRLIDLSDPTQPTEVAYFNPAMIERIGGDMFLDVAWGHVRYVPETGEIWLATAHGGFWVLEIQSQVQAKLGLDPTPSLVGDTVVRPHKVLRNLLPSGATQYCTLNQTGTLGAGVGDLLLWPAVR